MPRPSTTFFLGVFTLMFASSLSAAPPAPREVNPQPKASTPSIWLPFSQQYAPGTNGTLPPSAYLGQYPQYFPADGARIVGSPQAAPPPAITPKVAARPIGAWVREIGPVKVVMKITDDRLTATAIFATGSEEWPVVRVTLDANYAIAKDGTLFGVIFGADATHPMYATIIQPFAGQPFAFGWRVDGDTLTVRNLKGFGSGLPTEKASAWDELPVLGNGRYTRMDEAKIAEWEKKLNGTATPLMRTVTGGLTAPAPTPSSGNTGAPMTMAEPKPLVTEEKPSSTTHLGGIPYPSGVMVIPHTNTSPPAEPAWPAGPAAQTRIAPVASPFIGTWTRDVGACQVTLTITPSQIMARMNLDPTGRQDVGGVVFTADYTVQVDGKTVQGKITGTDVLTKKSIGFFEAKELRKVARELDNRILVFEFRVGGGFLSISNAGPLQDRGDAEDPLAAFAGVYMQETAVSDIRTGVFDPVSGAAGPAKADSSWPGDQYFSGRFERVTGKIPPPKPMPGLLINRYVEDPNIRFEQLQRQAGELKQINEERDKFWSNDMQQLSMPKGKEIAPPVKLPPAENRPVPMIPRKGS